MAYDDFVGEYSNLLAQEHGERIVAESERHEAREGFDEKMPQAKKDKKMLMAVGDILLPARKTLRTRREPGGIFKRLIKINGDEISQTLFFKEGSLDDLLQDATFLKSISQGVSMFMRAFNGV